MTIFVNPLRETKYSALNLTVGRVIIGAFGAWIVLSYDFGALADWPEFIMRQHRLYGGVVGPIAVIQAEQWAAAAMLLAFAAGWQVRVTATTAALLLIHLGAVNMTVSNWKVLAFFIYPLLIFALYTARGDRIPRTIRPLQITLVMFAIIYAITGLSKLTRSGVSWFGPGNLRGTILVNATQHLDGVPRTTEVLLSNDFLLIIASVATVTLELAFIVLVLIRAPIGTVMVGLLAMHVIIAVTMGINYVFSLGAIYLLFVPWEEISGQLRRRFKKLTPRS